MEPGPGTGAIVVTGAASGIGAAVAERLRADGRLVIGLDIEPCAFTPSLEVDVADFEGHEALVASIWKQHGRIWGLANIAGVSLPETIADLTVAAYRRQLGVMLDGPIWLARAAGLHMAAHGGGRIVNITSIHGQNSERTALAYDAAKGGLEAATRTLAIELGELGVLVNSVAPGFVRTNMSIVNGRSELESDWFRTSFIESGRLPLGRAAEPDEIAPLVAFLLSPENTYVSGARVVADGALTVGF